MIEYSKWAPTQFDTKGLNLEDRQDWLVCPVIRTRDSDTLERSNFEVMQNILREVDSEEDNWEVHRFGHWGPGWFEIILVRPDTECMSRAQEAEDSLCSYSVLCDEHFSQLEHEDAQETWKNCYTDKERIEYIEDHRRDFEFSSLEEMMSCVRGKVFCGSVSDMVRG